MQSSNGKPVASRKGALFRAIHRTGRVWGTGMTPKVLREIVREAASRAGVEKLAPSRPPPYLCEALPFSWRRIGSDRVFCSVIFRSRPQSVISAASRTCVAPLITESVSSRRRPNCHSRRRATRTPTCVSGPLPTEPIPVGVRPEDRYWQYDLPEYIQQPAPPRLV